MPYVRKRGVKDMIRIVQPALSIGLLSLLLGGCSTFSSSDAKCMKTALVTSVSTMPLSRVVAGDHRNIIISAFKGGCGGASPELPGESDDIGITLTLTAPEAKQPTGQTRGVTLPLFVALLDKQDNVKDRLDENIKVTISDHALNHTHKITYHPPEGIDVDNQDYRILVGFNAEAAPAPHSKPASVSVSKAKKKPFKKKRRKKVRRKRA
jgi:hypothetical protein